MTVEEQMTEWHETEHKGFAQPAWVVGDEPAVVVDWYGASNYAKSGRSPRRRTRNWHADGNRPLVSCKARNP